MSCEVIQPPTNPVLATEIVIDIQDLFSSKDYLDVIYPIAYVGFSKEEVSGSDTHKYPRVYLNDGTNEYKDVMPDDNLKGYTFFEIEGNSNYDQLSEEFSVVLNQIFWLNLRKIDDKGYDYTDLIKADVLRTLVDSSIKIEDIKITDNYEFIYSKYNLPQKDFQQFMYPFSGFKVTYSVRDCVNVSCLPYFTITSTPSDC